MTRRGAAIVAAVALLAYAALAVLVLVAPGAALAPVDAVLDRVLAVARRLPHDVLQLNPGFVRAALLAVVTSGVPVSAAGLVGHARRRRVLALVAAALALGVVAAALRVPGENPGGDPGGDPARRLVSLAVAVGAGYGLGVLIVAVRSALLDFRGTRGPAATREHNRASERAATATPVATGERVRATGNSRRLAVALALLYAAAVTAIAFHAAPVDRGSRAGLVALLARLHAVGLPPWVDYGTVEFSANVVYFVPLGLLVVLLAGGGSWRLATALGFGVSVVIEVAQDLFLPARVASVDDVLSNTAGACLGALLGVLTLAWMARRRMRTVPLAGRETGPITR